MSHVLPEAKVADSPVRQLVDRLGRVHRSLRISVTDACNIRCQYCMPEVGAKFLPASHLFSFEQIEAFVRAVVRLGVCNLRLTGGEPLLRQNLHQLVHRLAGIDEVEDLALTTNGMLLAPQVAELVAAGLRRINISLDTLSEATFQRISRRSGLNKVLEGIDAACQQSGLEVKLNALVLRDVNLHEVVSMVEFASERGLQLRFIEFMPLDAERAWSDQRMVSGQELRSLIAERLGPLEEVPAEDPSRPARDYRFADGRPGALGFIDSVSAPFCSGCDRLRLTADGKIRNCLFGQQEWDVGQWLRPADNEEGEPEDRVEKLYARLRECVLAKHPAHGIADPNFKPPSRAMFQIGG